MRYLFHGTNKENYEAIMKHGSTYDYTHWTHDLSSALAMGGAYVIVAIAPTIIEKQIDLGYWQFCLSIEKENFVACLKYDCELLYHNSEPYINKRKEENGVSFCDTCNGRGEINYPEDGHQFLIGGSRFDGKEMPKHEIEVCPNCLGYGTIGEKK